MALINLQRELFDTSNFTMEKMGLEYFKLVPFRTVKNCTRKEYLSRVKSFICLFFFAKKIFFSSPFYLSFLS